jgi:CheY-like chemotaxis protein
VLIVGDECDARELTCEVLEARGALAAVAPSAPEALHLLAGQPYDLVIADTELPDRDRFALIRAVRSLPARTFNREVPAIALTADTGSGDRDALLAAGFTALLVKPVDPERLIAAVSAAIGDADVRA